MSFVNARTAAYAVAVIAICFGLWKLNNRQTQAAFDGQQAHAYLCFLKQQGIPQQVAVINARIDAQLKYEQDVQLGIRKPVPGITQADIEQGLQSNQDDLTRLRISLAALVAVKCSPLSHQKEQP